MARQIDIVSLYPKDMNIYGDSGNVLTVERRLALYGYEPRIHAINQNDPWPDHADIILGGGGQDNGQRKIIEDLFRRADLLRSLAQDGVPMLMICGLYQLFGEYFETVDGSKLEGISIIGAYTVGRDVRMIGNLTETSEQFGRIVGYENHSGQTFLREHVRPLGSVDADGCGNDHRLPEPCGRRTPLRHVYPRAERRHARRARALGRTRRTCPSRGRGTPTLKRRRGARQAGLKRVEWAMIVV